MHNTVSHPVATTRDTDCRPIAQPSGKLKDDTFTFWLLLGGKWNSRERLRDTQAWQRRSYSHGLAPCQAPSHTSQSQWAGAAGQGESRTCPGLREAPPRARRLSTCNQIRKSPAVLRVSSGPSLTDIVLTVTAGAPGSWEGLARSTDPPETPPCCMHTTRCGHVSRDSSRLHDAPPSNPIKSPGSRASFLPDDLEIEASQCGRHGATYYT